MTRWKRAYHAVGTMVVVLLSIGCDSTQPTEVSDAPQSSRVRQSESPPQAQNEVDPDRQKIIGKGAYLGEDADSSLWFQESGPVPISRYLEFARKNPDTESADDALLGAASKLMTKGDYEQAMVVLDIIIKRYPHSAKFNMGACLDLTGSIPHSDQRKTQAAMAIGRHINDHPNFTADIALWFKAIIHEELGETTEAIKLLEQYVEKHPRGRWATEDTKVRPHLKPFVFRRRIDEIAFCQLAWLYHDSGNHTKANRILTQAIKTFAGSPNLVFYYDLLAKTHEKTGNVTEEANALTQVGDFLRGGQYSTLLQQLEETDRKKLRLNSYEQIWLRVRTPEEIDQRLRELGVKGDGSKPPSVRPPGSQSQSSGGVSGRRP